LEKNERRKYREDEHGRKKVKYMGLYSTDTTFPQHKHDKFSLKAKGEKTAVKLTRGEFVAASVLLRSLLVKRMASIKTRPHMRSMGTMPLYIYLLPLHLSGDRKDVNE